MKRGKALALAMWAAGMSLAATRGLGGVVFTTMFSFGGTNGAAPIGGLAQGADGAWYGTASKVTAGFSSSNSSGSPKGAVFRITTNNVLTTVASFNGTNGSGPASGLVAGADGGFYGTTYSGGSNGFGTVFQMSSNGVVTTLVTFNGENGANPAASLLMGADGALYGTTPLGGSNNQGVVFQISPDQTFHLLHTFGQTFNDTGSPLDGGGPTGSLTQGRDGALYGTTSSGGSSGDGTVFRITTNQTFTILHSFGGILDASGNPLDGWAPAAGLAQGADGDFYGTTSWGGAFTAQDPTGNGYGTVFKITTNGALTTLASFHGSDGAFPAGALIEGADGAFYGATVYGGPNTNQFASGDIGYGTVFQLAANGVLSTLVFFDGTNGANPFAGLAQGGDGSFYGTTVYGGPYTNQIGGAASGYGTIFRLSAATTRPLFTSIVKEAGGVIELTGSGPANQSYRLWAAPSVPLAIASWTLLTNGFFDSNGGLVYPDTSATTNAARFYLITAP